MGLIVNGKWVDQWYDTKESAGEFRRQESRFRHTISNEPDNPYQVEQGRYHLYVSLACPWAHRTTIYRKLKGLEDMISLSVVHPFMRDYGWTFKDGDEVFTRCFDSVHIIAAQECPNGRAANDHHFIG